MEILVVGAGVVGLAVARALAARGHGVIVAEATGGIGNGVSSRNSEVIHAGMYYPSGSLRARHCVAGRGCSTNSARATGCRTANAAS
jgi:L-2-hydroxyglutarate oxidase LhgO